MNWRDARHPRAGGAEFYTQALARRFVSDGNHVEWFTAAFPGSLLEELIDGVHIVRKGRQWTTHVQAFRRYRNALHNRFDLVVDEINTIPFFTPLWSDIPTVALIWQLAREVWWYESPFPLNAIGFAAEPAYLRLYRRTPVITFSESTASDLRHLGFDGRINLVPVGIEPIAIEDRSKDSMPTFVFVGRLAPSKRVHEIIEAFSIFRRSTGQGRLVLIGSGPDSYVQMLQRQSVALGIDQDVEFAGWLRGADKYRRIAAAKALLMASVREGWGLVVTESNACGTPAIVYDVAGLRDSVRNLETGLIVAPNPQSLAQGMLALSEDKTLYDRLSGRARALGTRSTFDASYSVIRDTVAKLVGNGA